MKKMVVFASLVLIACSAFAGANKYFKIKLDGFGYVRGMDTDEVWPLTRRTYAYIPVSAAQYGDGSKDSWDVIPQEDKDLLLDPVKDEVASTMPDIKRAIRALMNAWNKKVPAQYQVEWADVRAEYRALEGVQE